MTISCLVISPSPGKKKEKENPIQASKERALYFFILVWQKSDAVTKACMYDVTKANKHMLPFEVNKKNNYCHVKSK